MSHNQLKRLEPASLDKVAVDGPFWVERLATNRVVTLPIEYKQLETTGRIAALKLDWRPGDPAPPHIFWDSDVAKWIEAAAYSLATHPDADLERLVDSVIDLIADAQQDDGYLNTHFTVVEPENRWTNLREMHELYCAGHLVEAAVAYFEGTGKRRLLDVLCRYIDVIDSVFGPGEGQKRGYPGHEEIELALVKLYRVTGERRYLDLAEYFLDERGRQPHYFDLEAHQRGDDPADFHGRGYNYNQSHLPVREQTATEGHAVRAMYLFSGMADVAAETGDEPLLNACKTLWKNVCERRMYVTGGVGSFPFGERFTYDYDLPNVLAYAETCAAIGLVFWAHRMLQIEPDGRFADVMERALYNGVLSGVSLDGTTFFYANPLAMDPKKFAFLNHLWGRTALSPTRQEWFGTSCCPPNIARLLASLGTYVYSCREREIYVHLYTGGGAALKLGDQMVLLQQETRYPWEGEVRITVRPEAKVRFTLALRIPGWAEGGVLQVNGQPLELAPLVTKGYAKIDRLWEPGDTVTLDLPMPVQRVEAHPRVREDCGRVALQRGPIVYCLEEVDNGADLSDICLSRDAALSAQFRADLLGGVVAVTGEATRREMAGWDDRLYRKAGSPVRTVSLKAIPYYAWANRTPGEMLVWIRET